MEEGPSDRRVMAVVMVDIVDSSATLAATGVGAAVAERARLASLAASCASETGGQVVADEGDAAVIAFRSAVRAATCSLRLVRAATTEAFDVRVGMTLGELQVDNAGTMGRPDDAVLERVALVQAAAPVGTGALDQLARNALLGNRGLVVEALQPHPDLGPVHRLVSAADETELATDLHVAMLVEFSGPVEVAKEMADVTRAMIAHGATLARPHSSGTFAIVRSCRDAVETAASVHQHVSSANIEGQRAPVVASIALAVGEIAADVDDRFGRPVIEAARLLAYGTGSTAVSGDVLALAGPFVSESTEFVTSAVLKGLHEPVEVHRIAPRAPDPLVELPSALVRAPRFSFAGRAAELDGLRSIWSDVVAGDLVGVIASGAEGVGKTRLAAELAAHSQREGATVLFGSCDEDLPQAYAPITSALAAAAPIDPMIAEALGGRGPLAQVFARVAINSASLDRVDLFDGLTQALARLAERRPLLLVLDDVQWATPETVELIEHILADPATRSIMVLGTCRDNGLERHHPVRRLLRSSRLVHRVVRCHVGPLGIGDVMEMLESRANRSLEAAEVDFAETITAVTGGNPLFVEELLVHLSSTGALVHDGTWRLAGDVAALPLPESILELMAHRIARLPADVSDLLTVAALIGTEVEPSVLAAAVDRPIEVVMDAVDVATTAGLLRADASTGAHRFGDEITRQASLRALGPGRRALVHRSVAGVLEELDPRAHDALAHHWEAAGGNDGMRRAVTHLQVSAERDMASAAWESAIVRLRRSVDLLDRLDDQGDHIRGEIHYLLGASLRMIGDEGHRPDLVFASGCARRLGNASLLARCALAMMRPGAWYPEAGIVDEVITAMCEDALFLLPEGDALRPEVIATLATNLSYDPDVDRRWSLVREAQALAERLGDARVIGMAGAAELIACQEPELIERRWELALQVQQIGRATGNRELAFTGGFFVLLEHLARGEIDEVETLAPRLSSLADDMGGYWPQFLAGHIATLLAIARADPDARELIEAERAKFEHQPVDTLGISVIQQAGIAMAEGSLSDMLVPFAEAVDKYSDVDEWTKKWNFVFARAYLEAGDFDEAVAMIEAYPNPDVDRYWLPSMCQLGEIGLALGHVGFCTRALRELEPYRDRFAVIGVGAAITGQVSTTLGQAALGLGQLSAAEDYLRQAVSQATRAGFPYFEVKAKRLLATVLHAAHDDTGEVDQLLEAVLAVAGRHGFTIEVAEASALRAE